MAQTTYSNNNELGHTLRWIGGIVITVLLGCGASYATYINTSITTNAKEIVDVKLDQAHFEGDIQVLDSKLNFLIDTVGGEYYGPQLHPHRQSKDGK